MLIYHKNILSFHTQIIQSAPLCESSSLNNLTFLCKIKINQYSPGTASRDKICYKLIGAEL